MPALLALGALTQPAAASLEWSPPATFPGSPNHVHIDARGDVLAVWQLLEPGSGTSTFYAWRPPRGDWTAPRRLGPPEASPVFALTPRGDATAVWTQEAKIVAAQARPGDAFESPRIIGDDDPRSPYGGQKDLAVDDAGNALLAWAGEMVSEEGTGNATGHSIYAATRSLRGEWSEPQLIRSGSAGAGPAVSMNAAGAAAVAWMEARRGEPHISYRPPAGSFGPPERVPVPEGVGIPRVAVGDGGEAVVGTASVRLGAGEPTPVFIAARLPLGGWSEPTRFDTTGPLVHVFAEPGGTVTMLMTNTSDRDHYRVESVRRSAAGEILGPTTIATDRLLRGAAMNLRGAMLVAMDQGPHEAPIELAEREGGERAFGAPETVPGSFGHGSRGAALNDAGQAAIMWSPPNFGAQVAVREDRSLPVLPFPPIVEIDAPATPQLDGDGDLLVTVRCSSNCKAVAKGILATGGSEKLVAGTGPSRRLRADRRGRLAVRFGVDQARMVRGALRAGRKPWVSVSVRARGKSPRPMTVSRRTRLR